MKQPNFWYQPPRLVSWLLSPLAACYGLILKIRFQFGRRTQADIPVICIGNLNVGGSGKTPTAIAIAERIKEKGETPHFVSRGYRGSKIGPLKVIPNQHNSAMVGDEPLLLESFAPTWVAKNRFKGVQAAASSEATIAILDDGYQNPSLYHDLSIVVVDAVQGFGNQRILPAGPLRETVSKGLSRADILLVIGEKKSRARFLETWDKKISLPIVEAEINIIETGIDWKEMRIVAFAGIGYPEKFFHILKKAGANVVEEVALSDHAALGDKLMQRLESTANATNAVLVTTEKDAVRLPRKWKSKVLSLPVRLQILDWRLIDQKLEKSLSNKASMSD